jgi:hypothetical protein
MTDNPSEPPSNKTNAIASILTSGNADTWVKLGTLALVVVSGGGNLMATKQAERITDEEAKKAVKEIHELYLKLDTMVDRQREMSETIHRVDQQTKPAGH